MRLLEQLARDLAEVVDEAHSGRLLQGVLDAETGHTQGAELGAWSFSGGTPVTEKARRSAQTWRLHLHIIK